MKTAKLIGILVLVLALGIVIIQNRAPVQTHFLLVTVEMPQILLLMLTAGAGFALGLLVALFDRPKLKLQKKTPGNISISERAESFGKTQKEKTD